jgi:A/G-specific adenine glycosylase
MDFAQTLIKWYLENKRDLPWRDTLDPYKIWLSEIMLQQTRVAQGLPYYLAFVANYPTVFDLANADEEAVLKLWQGLGYYSRARNLHQTARFIAHEKQGVFPKTYQELLQLKGIGTYTAAAIASFSYNENVPVVDGNVFRVLARFFDIETDIVSPLAKKTFTNLAFELMANSNPAQFNQAIMEFGALQCVPKNPSCSSCIFNHNCAALQKNKVGLLPVKSKKAKAKSRFFNYFVFTDINQNRSIQKRTQKDIWHNLYEFPLLETEKEADFETVEANIYQFHAKNEIQNISKYNQNNILHKLTHQHLHINFWKVELGIALKNGLNLEVLQTFPFPIVVHNFIENELAKQSR